MSNDPSENETDIQKAARSEQLWYTATMIGVNALLMSGDFPRSLALAILIILVSLVLSLYAVALITNRAKKYARAGRVAKAREDNSYRASAFKDFFGNLSYVIREGEGSLFFVMLVFASCCGAVLKHLSVILPCD
jgi:hypothetical protein